VALRGLIDVLVTDLIETTGSRIRAAGVATLEDVRDAGRPLAGLSPEVGEHNRGLKTYLKTHMYQHHRIERMKDKARRVLQALCVRYFENSRLLPDDVRHRTEVEGLHRAIADYVAGMTDRYASEEYQRLFDPTVRV
jgi:dGTPase